MLPGAAVTATHTASGVVVERVTDNEGRFFLPALRIGVWNVEARLAGLAPQVHRGIVVEVGRSITLEFSLGVQGVTELNRGWISREVSALLYGIRATRHVAS